MANVITFCRILFGIPILFFPAFSPLFYVFYVLCGLSDMLDGAVARKTNTVSAFGSKLDTVADLVFVAICMVKLLPVLNVPLWLWICIGIVAFVKIVNVVLGYAIHKKFAAVHTVMNKITGALWFLFPFTVTFLDLRYSGGVICAVALFAAIQEGYLILKKGTEYS